jgi:hypothetical protein
MYKMANLVEIRPVGSRFGQFGRMDKPTQMSKLIATFHNFVNARKK